jgi:hypothetical protein
MTGGNLDTKGGPKATPDGQVLDTSDQAIPGLYGVGNCVASASARAYLPSGPPNMPATKVWNEPNEGRGADNACRIALTIKLASGCRLWVDERRLFGQRGMGGPQDCYQRRNPARRHRALDAASENGLGVCAAISAPRHKSCCREPWLPRPSMTLRKMPPAATTPPCRCQYGRMGYRPLV